MAWTRLILRFSLLGAGLFLGVVITLMDYGRSVPVGEQMAYVSNGPGIAWDIFLMDIDRRLSYDLSRLFIKGQVRSRLPAWSADGRQLAFVSQVSLYQDLDVMIMQPDVFTLRFLIDGRDDETAPVWSPAGNWLAYEIFNGDDWDIRLKQVVDEHTVLIQQSTITSRGADRNPVWSPDGTQIAFTSDRDGASQDIYLTNLHGSPVQRLTRFMAVEGQISWSPTGMYIALSSKRDGNQEIYIVNVENRAVTNLSRHPSEDFAPVWSPDGTMLAFVSMRDGDAELFLMDMTGDNVQQLTHNNVYDGSPVWSSDGTRLLYLSEPEFTSEIYLLDLQTGKNHRLTRNTVEDWSPGWRN